MDLILCDTPLGRIGLGGEGEALVRLFLPGVPIPPIAQHETPVLARAREQLLAYLAGERTVFDLPLAPQGTEFQTKVWAALSAISPGETRTYSDIAATVGSPKAVRAVGRANHNNPIPIFIPCHRVVGKGGALVGYAGGISLKRTLLDLEGVHSPC